MTSNRLIAGIVAAALGLGLAGPALGVAVAAPPTGRPGAQATASALPTSPLSAAEKATLLRMADEERMARDLYTTIAEKYPDATQFSRVAASEQQHYDRVLTLLDRYALTVPSAVAGTYDNAEVQQLYDGWLARAQQSRDEAYRAAVALEQADVKDLQAAIDESDNADLDQVYGRLLAASQQHEQAFTAGSVGAVGTDPLGNGGQGHGQANGQGLRDGSCLQN